MSPEQAPRRARLRRELLLWLTSFGLILPAAIPFVCNLLHRARGLVPTGFIQIDMPQYMAYARELFDGGGFHLLYGSPSSPVPDAPRIYFQIQTVLLGLLGKATGWSPGVTFFVFGFVAALACARVAIALYEAAGGRLDTWPGRIGLLMFFWGGGVLVLAGAARCSIISGTCSVFDLDPTQGWWFLNFGRNFVLPTEAYYHALFFGSLLCVVRNQLPAAALLVLLLTLSHPFSSVELLAILVGWSLVERFFVKSERAPGRWLLWLGGVAAIFVCYYLVYLNLFPSTGGSSRRWSSPGPTRRRASSPPSCSSGCWPSGAAATWSSPSGCSPSPATASS